MNPRTPQWFWDMYHRDMENAVPEQPRRKPSELGPKQMAWCDRHIKQLADMRAKVRAADINAEGSKTRFALEAP